MRRILTAAVVAVLTVWGFSPLGSLPIAAAEQGEPTTITGYVRDSACYVMMDLKGRDHKMCALACAKNGIPLVIVTDDGTIYMSVTPGHPAKSANPLLKDYVEKKVKVTGVVGERGGMKMIAVQEVEAA